MPQTEQQPSQKLDFQRFLAEVLQSLQKCLKGEALSLTEIYGLGRLAQATRMVFREEATRPPGDPLSDELAQGILDCLSVAQLAHRDDHPRMILEFWEPSAESLIRAAQVVRALNPERPSNLEMLAGAAAFCAALYVIYTP